MATREQGKVPGATLPTAPPGATPRTNGLRRSQRVYLNIPITVYGWAVGGEVFNEETTTVVVNSHGALILLKNKIEPKQQLFVRNERTGEEAKCYVANVGSTEGERTEIGLGFVDDHPAFWQVHFPPDDWDSATRKRPTAPATAPKPAPAKKP